MSPRNGVWSGAIPLAGEGLLRTAYATVLREVLRVVAEQAGDDAVMAPLEEVGRRVGHTDRPSLRIEERVEATAERLRALGGDIEIVTEPEGDGAWRVGAAPCRLSSGISPPCAGSRGPGS